jgi:hypothetical protein
LERSNDHAGCGRGSKFNPLILGEIQAADDKGRPASIDAAQVRAMKAQGSGHPRSRRPQDLRRRDLNSVRSLQGRLGAFLAWEQQI